ncbi:MAG: hypothetical protein R3321_07200 [Nitrososphaeraceae archaeon]|nr:hypothetical protein [Nitrososphaeraceae archaeon]
MEYFYTRELQADSRYNIGYVGEKISLAEEIQDTFPSHSVKVMCNGTTVKVEISPTLSAGEKTTLDTIVSDHKNNIDPAPTAFKVNEEYIIDPNVNVNHFSLHRQDIKDTNGSLI